MNADLKSMVSDPTQTREREHPEQKTSVASHTAPAAYRHFALALFVFVCVVAFWPTLKPLVHAALNIDFCSQILVAPFITIVLVYLRRKEIFRTIESAPAMGGLILLVGLIVYWLAHRNASWLGSYNTLSAAAFGMVLVWAAGFCAVYGSTAFRAAAFPLGFLLATVPIPSSLLDRTVFCLQYGSTSVAHGLFRMFKVPVVRHGFLLFLPGLTIEVAKECSSIRSSLALVITCLLAGYIFLRSAWKRTALVLLALPLSIFKNGVRIVTLSLLSIYVNPAFMTSRLHRDGGILFYLLALAILFPIFRWFQKSDREKVPQSRP